jgi:hypothetical protein
VKAASSWFGPERRSSPPLRQQPTAGLVFDLKSALRTLKPAATTAAAKKPAAARKKTATPAKKKTAARKPATKKKPDAS